MSNLGPKKVYLSGWKKFPDGWKNSKWPPECLKVIFRGEKVSDQKLLRGEKCLEFDFTIDRELEKKKKSGHNGWKLFFFSSHPGIFSSRLRIFILHIKP